jgi:hypothetical protein
MSHLEAALAARAFRSGRACRSAQLRHRRFVARPLAIVLYELGAEPFSAAAISYGTAPENFHQLAAGEPRNRDLAFAMLLRFARWFNSQFERPGTTREVLQDGDREVTRAVSAPQIVVVNRASVEMLGRLGRRLAYLPTDGPRPADPELVRLGQHLQFLARHASQPGQQLVISLTDLVNAHWVTPQSDFERASLGAVDAYIDPPASPAWDWQRERLGLPVSTAWRARRARAQGFETAALAERFPIGPVPDGDDDEVLEPLVDAFNAARDRRTTPRVIEGLVAPIHDHYRPLLQRTWEMLWHVFERERAWPESPSVARRWDEDRDAYTRHLDWTSTGGRNRTRQTPRQSAMTMRRLEDAKARLRAEEACDDSLRMIPYLLANKAIEGRVVRIDLDHKEVARVRAVRRPLLTLLSVDPCPMPRNRQLWWTGHPRGPAWVVQDVTSRADGSAVVTLQLSTSSSGAPMPAVGDHACFSMHNTEGHWSQKLPDAVPWTHRPATPPPALGPIEEQAS